MISRILAASIVLFWLTMTGLLIRNELRPEESALRTVPVSHVVKLLFAHQQASDLGAFADGIKIGHLRIHPTVEAESGRRYFDMIGSIQLRLPTGGRQRLSMEGRVDFTPELQFQDFSIWINMHEPSVAKIKVQFVAQTGRARLAVGTGGATVFKKEITADASGVRELLAALGVDPALVPVQSVTFADAHVTARQSKLRIRNEPIETYLVSYRHGDNPLLDAHVSQLGQVLEAKTPFGFILRPDEVVP